MKKLLDSDWLRAVQFKCNTGVKSVTSVQITHVIWVFQKAEIALAEAACAISAFWKTHSCKLNSKPYDYLY